jgi:hypothetical protein
MKFDNLYKSLLEDFDGLAPGVSPKNLRAFRTTGQGMTTGDSDAPTFNSVKEIDGDLIPTPEELKQAKKAKKKKKSVPVYLPGKNKPGI